MYLLENNFQAFVFFIRIVLAHKHLNSETPDNHMIGGLGFLSKPLLKVIQTSIKSNIVFIYLSINNMS